MSDHRAGEGRAPVVRDATPADVPALTACYAPARHAERIRAADGRTVRYLVVEVAGEVVGFGRLVLVQPAHGRLMRYLPVIMNLNVRADMRNRGLATVLIRTMERMAREAGCHVLHIGVHRQNTPAFSLYRSLGFAPFDDPAVDPDAARRAAVVHLRKTLSP
jgi:GNAT superfamily N-acetyltransferase